MHKTAAGSSSYVSLSSRQVSLGNATKRLQRAAVPTFSQKKDSQCFPSERPQIETLRHKNETKTHKSHHDGMCLVVFGLSLDLCSRHVSLSSLSSFCGRLSGFLCGSLSDGFISQLFRFFSFWIFRGRLASPSLFVAAVFLCGHFVSFLLRYLCAYLVSL